MKNELLIAIAWMFIGCMIVDVFIKVASPRTTILHSQWNCAAKDCSGCIKWERVK